MQGTRAQLQNPANSGPAGTVHFSITINDTATTPGSLTLSLLKNFDVFFIGYLNDNNPNALTALELANLHTWVTAGGVLIVTCDEDDYDAVCADFGHPATTTAENPMVPTDGGQPIFNGPFGAVPSFLMEGTQGYFTSTAGADVLAHDSSAEQQPVFLSKTVGAGRVILFSDVDIIADTLTPGAGVLIVTCDEEGYDAVCTTFGHPATTSALNPMVPVGAGVSHPIFAGPFGTVANFNMQGTQGHFTMTTGATVLAEDSTAGTPRPVFLIKTVRAGRVILFSDVDIIANAASGGGAITTGNDRVLANLFYFAGVPGADLLAAVLPYSRSVQVGITATAFATVLTSGPGMAVGCTISPITPVAANFSFVTTNPPTNEVSGLPNVPVTIVDGQQSFVMAFTPTAAFPPTDVRLAFDCPNTPPAAIISGLDTFLLSASSNPVPDIIALIAAAGGIVGIPGPNGAAAFAVATANVSTVGGTIVVSANTGPSALPVTLLICQTDPGTGLCTSAIGETVQTTIGPGETPTFAIFVLATGNVPFDPARNRIYVLFLEGGIIRGATSVAVRTE